MAGIFFQTLTLPSHVLSATRSAVLCRSHSWDEDVTEVMAHAADPAIL